MHVLRERECSFFNVKRKGGREEFRQDGQINGMGKKECWWKEGRNEINAQKFLKFLSNFQCTSLM
jgi:hypothetical protein